MTDPIIIPFQSGDVIEYEGKRYEVSQHFAQGKDMKGLNYSHMMFNEKGAFGLVATDNHSQVEQKDIS